MRNKKGDCEDPTVPKLKHFSTRLTQNQGLSGNKKKESWPALMDTDTKQMSDIKHCTEKLVWKNTHLLNSIH